MAAKKDDVLRSARASTRDEGPRALCAERVEHREAEPRSRRARSEEEIAETLGFVPSFYGVLPDAALDHTVRLQRKARRASTTLEPRTRELIGLALASHIRCRWCIHFHVEAALRLGAAPEQVEEALAMGGLAVRVEGVTSDGAFEALRAEVDHALDHLTAIEPAEPVLAEASP